MTLEDVFKPNKFGTIPIIRISGVGSIMKYSDTHAKCMVMSREDLYLPLKCEVVLSKRLSDFEDSVSVRYEDYPELSGYVMYLTYLKQATAAERLIAQAINKPYRKFILNKVGIFSSILDFYEILPNGTGWLNGEPVTYYLDDILYRLDLQQKLT